MSKINVIGASCIDLLVSYVDKDKFFSGTYKVDNIKPSYGGDALNQSVVLSKLNNDVKLITIVGDDTYGKDIISYLDNRNIKYNDNIIQKDIETYISLVLIENNGDRLFVGNKNGSVRKLDLNHINIDEDCEIVSFGSLFISNELNDEKLTKLFKEITDRNIKLFVDCSSPKNNESVFNLNCLQYIDYLFMNLDEARALTNMNNIIEIYDLFKEKGVKNLIIKAGEDGAYYNHKYYPAIKLDKVIDTTGAGDSFVSGFIHSIVNNSSVEEAIEYGNKLGNLACRYIGATSYIDIENDF